jgi:hypothetical protein
MLKIFKKHTGANCGSRIQREEELTRKNQLVLNLRRAIPTIPTKPVPKSASEAGSGTDGVANACAENVVVVPKDTPFAY